MTRKNAYQARNPSRFLRGKGLTSIRREFAENSPAVYPSVPANWPNRATRRAVKQNREDRLTAPWKQTLAANDIVAAATGQVSLRAAIRGL